MSKYIPYAGYKWLNPNTNLDILYIYIFIYIFIYIYLDIEYPTHLHDEHRDLPFLPVKGSNQHKLLNTLHNKQKYICHYVNLKQAINHGLKVTKVHRILQFFQSPWLTKYVELNTVKRQQAKNDFER